MNSFLRIWLRGGLLLCLVAVPLVLQSAERRASNNPRTTTEATTVEMFAAIKSKDIDVKLIPKDDKESRVIITNKTKKPLNVRLPEAFAGVPVLAQLAGGGGGNRPGGGGTTQTQSMGGGMGGMGGGMGGMGGGMMGGMMNIPAEKVAQFKVATVCLEHGKKEPRAGIPYEIKPIEAVTSKPEVKELLIAFGKQRLNQRATQAAAWNLANDMTWQQLAQKRIEHLDGSSEPWFNPEEIQAGMQIARTAAVQAEARPSQSPGETGSLHQAVSKAE